MTLDSSSRLGRYEIQSALGAGGMGEVYRAHDTKLGLEKGEVGHAWPDFLPGGKALLFTAIASATEQQLAVQLIGTGDRRNLIPGGSPRYALSGHLVYAQAGNLMAVPFDPQRLTVTGAPVSVVAGILQSSQTGAAQYSLSATGSLVYVSRTGVPAAAQGRMVWVDRKGLEQALPQPARSYANPRRSPDGQRVAVSSNGDIWVGDLARGTLTRLRSQGSANLMGVWTPTARGSLSLHSGTDDGLFGGNRPTAVAHPNGCRTPSTSPRRRRRGLRTGNCSRSKSLITRQDGTSGYCGSTTTKRTLF
jgi:hypothetical protein